MVPNLYLLFETNAKAVGIVCGCGCPIRKDAHDAHLLPKHIQHAVNVAILGHDLLDGTVVEIAVLVDIGDVPRALQTPGDDLETELLSLLRVTAGNNRTILVGDEVVDWRGDILDTVLCIPFQVGHSAGEASGGIAIIVEVQGLLAEGWGGLEPVEDVVVEEALHKDILGVDAGFDDRVNHLLGIFLLRVVALKGHLDLRSLELRGVLETEVASQSEVFLEGHDRAASGVEISSPVWCSVEVRFGRGGVGIEAIHLGAESLVLFKSNVTGATFGDRRLAVLGWGEWRSTLGIELGDVDNVGRCVQVTLTMAADQLAILGEGDITLKDTSTHASSGHVGLSRVLGEL